MKHLSAIVFLALAACSHGQDFDPVLPSGFLTATLSPECASSPICVCSLPKERRPAKLVTPEAILRMYPDTPKELDYECDD